MSDPFISEIRIFAFDYPPVGWAYCNGTQIPVQQNQALFTLISTVYGGNTTAFNVPNMQGLVPVGTGQGPGLTARNLGQIVGAEGVALNSNQVAPHQHTINTATPANTAALQNTPANTLTFGPTSNQKDYQTATFDPLNPPATLHPLTIQAALGNSAGAADPHENRQPYLTLNFCICVNGVYPYNPN